MNNSCNNIKKIKISILGEDYYLKSDESDSIVLDAANIVSNSIEELSNKYPDIDLKKVSTLVAIQLATNLLKSKNLINDFKDYSDNLANNIDFEVSKLNNSINNI